MTSAGIIKSLSRIGVRVYRTTHFYTKRALGLRTYLQLLPLSEMTDNLQAEMRLSSLACNPSKLFRSLCKPPCKTAEDHAEGRPYSFLRYIYTPTHCDDQHYVCKAKTVAWVELQLPPLEQLKRWMMIIRTIIAKFFFETIGGAMNGRTGGLGRTRLAFPFARDLLRIVEAGSKALKEICHRTDLTSLWPLSTFKARKVLCLSSFVKTSNPPKLTANLYEE